MRSAVVSPSRTLLVAAAAWRQPAYTWLPRRSPLLQQVGADAVSHAAPAAALLLGGSPRSRVGGAPLMTATAAPPPSSSEASTDGCTRDMLGWLRARVRDALVTSFGDEYADADPLLTPATRPEFGDYQCNVAMGLGKKLKMKPRDIASQLVSALDLSDACEELEIAGPGFLNIRLKPSFIQAQLALMLADEARCAVPRAAAAQRVVVDYSSPNIAKEMHVGHLRSTIIGDTLARLLEFRGHDVLRLNHVGDWGTQFGMLIVHLREAAPEALTGEAALDISDLVALYKEAKRRFDDDADFQTAARAEVVLLQGGDDASRAAWRALCEQSEAAFRQVYEVLGVDERLEVRGESFYNAALPSIVDDLRGSGMLRESDGAQCIFLDGYTNRDGEPLPMIVQKSDGGYMYSTTDLAAMAQRSRDERADRVLYVTDSGQSLHFEQVFKIGRQAKLVGEGVSLEHVPFGLVLGEDGKKFKTRSGETVKLMDLLDEAVRRTRDDVTTRLAAEGRDDDRADDAFVEEVSRAVGIGAVKYADLSMNRNSNYRFSYDKMLALNG